MNDQESCTSCKQAKKWRDDFPVEWEGDNYVSRREMVKFLTLGSAFLAVANWTTAFASRFLRRGSKNRQLLGPSEDLKLNGSVLFRYPTDKDPCIAVRTAEESWLLTLRFVLISHAQSSMTRLSRACFARITTGVSIWIEVLRSRPPTRPLPRLRLEESNGQIYATEWEA